MYGETTDCAAQHPDIVARLSALAAAKDAEIGGKQPTARRPEGRVTQAKMLYPSPEDPNAAAAAAAAPADLNKLQPGDMLSGSAAPRVAQVPFEITLRVETAQSNCVLLAQGGITVGYALHLHNNQVVFSVRTGSAALSQIQSASAFTRGSTLCARLARDGTMTLVINEAVCATGKASGLLPQQPMEDFCVGFDSRKAVVPTLDNTRFSGTLYALRLQTSP